MSLIAHWPLNGSANDISGNGYNGTAYNVTYSNGKTGRTPYYDGSVTPYIVLPNASINNLQDFSFTF